MAKDKKNVIKIGTFIDASTVIDGDILSENNLKIDGRINGNVTIIHDLVVSKSGVVNGNITANAAVIEGIVTGNIATAETVTLAPSGRIDGDIETVGLIADIGSSFNGNCKVHKKEAQQSNKFEIKLPIEPKAEPKPEPKIEQKVEQIIEKKVEQKIEAKAEVKAAEAPKAEQKAAPEPPKKRFGRQPFEPQPLPEDAKKANDALIASELLAQVAKDIAG